MITAATFWTALALAAHGGAPGESVATSTATPSAPPAKAAVPAEMTEEQKVIYALGVVLGRNVDSFNFGAKETKHLVMGLKDWVGERKSTVDLNVYGPKIRELQAAKVGAQAEAEKKKAQAFLKKASKEKGAKAGASGLIYTELTKGSGPSPSAADTVKVHYRGTLTDGTQFDSSYDRGNPAEFPLNGVIACWTEGVQKMKVGGKAKLVCPSSIAYGDQGRPPTIPGGATLVFEVELLEVKGK